MSSYTRQYFPWYQVQCRAQIDALFYEYTVFLLFSTRPCNIMGALEPKVSRIFWKINLDKIIETDQLRNRVWNDNPSANIQE